jgi:enterobactin synthetase component D
MRFAGAPAVKVFRMADATLAVLPLADEPEELESAIHPQEQAQLASFGPLRRKTWLGGRSALRAALAAHGVEFAGPILSTKRGAPDVGECARVSISHKEQLAVALVADACAGSAVGVDVELDVPTKIDIARKILTDDELKQLSLLDASERDRCVRTVFSIKEAIYKAIDPFVGRYVAFREVELFTPSGLPARSPLSPRLQLREPHPPLTVSAWWMTDAAAPGYLFAAATASLTDKP